MPFFKTSSALEQQLVAEVVRRGGIAPGRLDFFVGREVPGRTTELKCSCGGPLQEVRHLADVPMPSKPTHKKRRILKKRMKRWEQEVEARALVFAAMFAMQRPMYRCVFCGRKAGFYDTMARNLFRVEPLPVNAVPFYTEEALTVVFPGED